MAGNEPIIEITSGGDRNPMPLGVRIGDLIYSPGIVGQNLETGALPQVVDGQLDLAFANMRTLIERAGATTDNIAHVTFFLQRLQNRSRINRPWLEMFPDEHDRPTYKFMEADLPGDRLVELQVLAVAGARRQLLNIPGIAHGNPIPMAVKIGNLLFTSRILPADPATGNNGDGPEAQATLAFRNMRTLLDMAGATPAQVSQVWVFVKEADHRGAVDKPWAELFGEGGPTRHDVVVDLPGNLLVMAECMAAVG
jgi:2-iminobutanoate/2-iminopropanoate deaminase